MQYPRVTEMAVERENIVHDTFIDGLETPPRAADAAAPRTPRHAPRRRRRTSLPAGTRSRA